MERQPAVIAMAQGHTPVVIDANLTPELIEEGYVY